MPQSSSRRSFPPSPSLDKSSLIIPTLRRISAIAILAWLTGATAFAQNSNLSDHDRYIHQQAENNTRYFRNADSYPPTSTDNYARFLQQQQARIPAPQQRDANWDDQPKQHQQTPGEYADELKQKARSGDAEAKAALANCYYSGWGVPLNKAETFRLYREAAATLPHAEFVTGEMLFAGDGIPENRIEGRAMIQRAAARGVPEAIGWTPLIEKNLARAAQGDVHAMADAGTQLIHGIGVDPDQSKGLALIQQAAAQGDLRSTQNLAYWSRTPAAGIMPYDLVKSHAWLVQAAEKGDVDAMDTVGTDLIVNQGIPVDVKEGLRWCLLAAEKGSTPAAENVAIIYNGGFPGVPTDRAKAITWFRKALAGGSKTAALPLAHLYEESIDGQKPDYARALELLAPLAAQGDVEAELSLGVYHDKGLGVPVDFTRAMEWFAKAAKAGSPRAMHELGRHYLDGTGVPVDQTRAIQFYRQAAALGFAPSLDSMGMFTFKGVYGVQQDELEGIRLFQLAGEKGDADAAFNLGQIYAEGIGVDADPAEARKWFQAGADHGSKKCAEKLAALH